MLRQAGQRIDRHVIMRRLDDEERTVVGFRQDIAPVIVARHDVEAVRHQNAGKAHIAINVQDPPAGPYAHQNARLDGLRGAGQAR